MSKNKNRKKSIWNFWKKKIIKDLPTTLLIVAVFIVAPIYMWFGLHLWKTPYTPRESLTTVTGHFVDEDTIPYDPTWFVGHYDVFASMYVIDLDDGNRYGVYCGPGVFFSKDTFREKYSQEALTLWIHPELSTFKGNNFYAVEEIIAGDKMALSLDLANTVTFVFAWFWRVLCVVGLLTGIWLLDFKGLYADWRGEFYQGRSRKKQKQLEKARREKKEKHMEAENLHSEKKK